MRNTGKSLLLLLVISTSISFTASPEKIVNIKPFSGVNSSNLDGTTLFKANCSPCHSIGKGRLVGPDLKGITAKRSETWLIKWTKSSQTLVKNGDKDAVAIFNEYNKIPMPDQNLSDEQIKAIFSYIKTIK